MAEPVPFWRAKRLHEMSEAEWESLCDGCGRCCLVKLEDEESGAIAPTSVACRLLDVESCRCGNYAERERHVPDCVRLKPDNIPIFPWLPASCAYRRLSEGKPLLWWHPLVSGSPETVHEAGVSVRNRVTAREDAVSLAQLEDHIVAWPMRLPRRPRPRATSHMKENSP